MPLAEIGTWFDDGETIRTQKQTAISGERRDGVIECYFAAADEHRSETGFCGRVALDAASWQGIIYHSRKFPAQRLTVVAEAFHLRSWRAVHDPVYDSGDKEAPD